MTWVYVAIIEFLLNCALGYLLYLAGKRVGKELERNANYLKMIDAQAETNSQAEAREKNYDQRMEKIEKHIYHTNVATIPDPELTELYKNPTNFDLSTSPESVSETDPTREAVPDKL